MRLRRSGRCPGGSARTPWLGFQYTCSERPIRCRRPRHQARGGLLPQM